MQIYHRFHRLVSSKSQITRHLLVGILLFVNHIFHWWFFLSKPFTSTSSQVSCHHIFFYSDTVYMVAGSWTSLFFFHNRLDYSFTSELSCYMWLRPWYTDSHYDDVIMSTIASQITSLTIVYSTIYSGADQSKHQSSASLAFVWGIHRGPVNSPHKWPVTRKMFPFDDVIMTCSFYVCNRLFLALPMKLRAIMVTGAMGYHHNRNVISPIQTKMGAYHCKIRLHTKQNYQIEGVISVLTDPRWHYSITESITVSHSVVVVVNSVMNMPQVRAYDLFQI